MENKIKDIGIYEDIYMIDNKDKYGHRLYHVTCKECGKDLYYPLRSIRDNHVQCRHIKFNSNDNLGIYQNVHESGNKSTDGHKLYYATCSVCGVTIEKLLSDLKRNNTLCYHKCNNDTNNKTYKVNDMPRGWVSASQLNTRTYNLWKSMIDRTTEKFWNKYPTYNGTTVDPSWRILSNFVNDIQYLQGYEMWANNPNQRIMLDKDTLVEGNKHYSKNTCCFITHAESNRDVIKRHPEINKTCGQVVAEKYGKRIKAINIDTGRSIIFNSQKEAARELDVLASHIWMILSKDQKYISHKTTKSPNGEKWTFEEI